MKARKNNLVKAVASVVVLLLPMASSAQPSLVILVRHAERAAEPADDPGLSEAGRSRATALLRSLEGSDISAIISSHYRRTRETAAPLATQHGIDVQIMAPGPAGIAAHVAEVAAAVRQQQGQVLVVGHSNTIPAIVTALSGKPITPLCESSYSHLFILIPGEDAMRLVKAHYGLADPPASDGCQ